MASQQIHGVAARESVPAKSASAVSSTLDSPVWLPVATLWWRELVRFYRQRSRVVGVLGTPLLFWLLIGAGFGDSFRPAGPPPAPGMGYLEYFFPGSILLVVLFTSIFNNISVIEDRHEGFLLSVLVAPISRSAVVMGKILGGATLALLQGTMFLLLAPIVGIRLHFTQAIAVIVVLFLNSFALAAVGFYFAWRLDSVQGFHGVMNLVLMPMWLLSGALFPVSGAHSWMGWIMRANPLTYGMAALRHLLYSVPPPDSPRLAVSVGVTAIFGILAAAAGWQQVKQPGARGTA